MAQIMSKRRLPNDTDVPDMNDPMYRLTGQITGEDRPSGEDVRANTTFADEDTRYSA